MGIAVKESDLSKLVRVTVQKTIMETIGRDEEAYSDQDELAYAQHVHDLGDDRQTSEVPEDLLDDATHLLMMVSGRIMSAKDTPVDKEIIAQAVHHIEQADQILDNAGLSPNHPDVMRENSLNGSKEMYINNIKRQASLIMNNVEYTHASDIDLENISKTLSSLVKKL